MLLRSVLPFPLLLLLSGVWADGQHTFRPGDLVNQRNKRYTLRVVIGAKRTVNVSLDTGSTDMWLMPPGGTPPFKGLGVQHNISYNDGGDVVGGTVGLMDMVIAGYVVPEQAFLNLTRNDGSEVCSTDACSGVIGLGFDSPKWGVMHSVNAAGLDGTKLARSPMQRIFDDHPDTKRFFAISFSRWGEVAPSQAKSKSNDDSFTVGTHDPRYNQATIDKLPKNEVYPPSELNWRILGNGMVVNGEPIRYLANNKDVPEGKQMVSVDDTGTTNMLFRPEVRDAIFRQIPGAALVRNAKMLYNTHWSADRDVWVVPCGVPINFTVGFGTEQYPIHPQDMVDMYDLPIKGPDGKRYPVCVGTIGNGGVLSNGTNDAMYGDAFLRNVYSVFSFGERTDPAKPYIQFLSQTDPESAAADYVTLRKFQLGNMPTELSPVDLIRLVEGREADMVGPGHPGLPNIPGGGPSGSSSGSGDGTGNCGITATKLQGALADGAVPDGATGGMYSWMDEHGPAILGLLAANLLLLLILLAFGILACARRSGVRSSSSPSVRYQFLRRSKSKYGGDGEDDSFDVSEEKRYDEGGK
ncbi:Six-hairpin glycosidase [Mycena kentingensis (nom. inval.)]|nr:Six-hairpin glycosidase [Mycena kentingensis (nom. inval.)]